MTKTVVTDDDGVSLTSCGAPSGRKSFHVRGWGRVVSGHGVHVGAQHRAGDAPKREPAGGLVRMEVLQRVVRVRDDAQLVVVGERRLQNQQRACKEH